MANTLYEIFQKLEKKTINKDEMDYLVSFVFKVAYIYLTHKYNSSVLFDKKVTTIDELAIDVSANLFYKNKDGLTKFYQALSLHKENINHEKDICYYLYKIVWSEVDRAVMFEMLKWNLIPLEVYK